MCIDDEEEAEMLHFFSGGQLEKGRMILYKLYIRFCLNQNPTPEDDSK